MTKRGAEIKRNKINKRIAEIRCNRPMTEEGRKEIAELKAQIPALTDIIADGSEVRTDSLIF